MTWWTDTDDALALRDHTEQPQAAASIIRTHAHTRTHRQTASLLIPTAMVQQQELPPPP